MLAGHLQLLLTELLAAGGGVAEIASLPAAKRAVVPSVYRAGLSHAFAVSATIAVLGLLMVLFVPLRNTSAEEEVTAVRVGPE